MEQTVSTAWYVKKCALGTFVCCAVEFALLALTAALMLGGAIGEEKIGAATLVSAAIAAFAGCSVGSRKTSKRAAMTLACAAASWLAVQVLGFAIGGGLEPKRSLLMAAVMLTGAAVSLMLHGGRKKKRQKKTVRARRGRR